MISYEFPTLTTDVVPTIATGLGNRVATFLGMQDISQLRKEYGKEQADVIINTVGNMISGQVTGDSARQLSERIDKIMQDRESLSINSGDTSISKSKQLDSAVPASTIAALSSGEFVGSVADTPQQKIALKAYHAEIINDFDAIQKEEAAYKPIPVIRPVNNEMAQNTYIQIRQDVRDIIEGETNRLMNDPALAHLVIKKNNNFGDAGAFSSNSTGRSVEIT